MFIPVLIYPCIHRVFAEFRRNSYSGKDVTESLFYSLLSSCSPNGDIEERAEVALFENYRFQVTNFNKINRLTYEDVNFTLYNQVLSFVATLLEEHGPLAVGLIFGINESSLPSTESARLKFDFSTVTDDTNQHLNILQLLINSWIRDIRMLDCAPLVLEKDSLYMIYAMSASKACKIFSLFARMISPKLCDILFRIDCLQQFTNIVQRIGNDSVHPFLLRGKKDIVSSLYLAWP